MLTSTYFPPQQPAHSWVPSLAQTAQACTSLLKPTPAWTPDAALSDPQDPTCLSGSRARSISGLEPWLWLPSLGFPLPRTCRQSSLGALIVLLRLLPCFKDILKSRCPLSMQTGPCRGVQPFKRGDPQRSPFPMAALLPVLSQSLKSSLLNSPNALYRLRI